MSGILSFIQETGMTTALTALTALLIDWWLGEPRRFHPLAGFGRLACVIEQKLYQKNELGPRSQRIRGALALALLLAPLTATTAFLCTLPYVGVVFSVSALYFALGHRSLHDHARPVVEALRVGNEPAARHHASLIVSRDAETLDITTATTESVLENGNDGVFGALFWFVLAGGAGAVFYRLVNTLDAMWGYRNDRYRYFGWAAARLDDVLNYLPARLTALTYALLGKTRQALKCWKNQAPAWDSPNAGPVMAAGAGALNVSLGGRARYQGEWHERPQLGAGAAPRADDIERALKLVQRGVGLWLAFMIAGGVLHNG
jgi:adenosylcobinamide-phosphate synthase